MKSFKKSETQIAELFTSCSGEIDLVRAYLEGKSVDRWSHLEDLALALPESSP
jgi:hypothetical protein